MQILINIILNDYLESHRLRDTYKERTRGMKVQLISRFSISFRWFTFREKFEWVNIFKWIIDKLKESAKVISIPGIISFWSWVGIGQNGGEDKKKKERKENAFAVQFIVQSDTPHAPKKEHLHSNTHAHTCFYDWLIIETSTHTNALLQAGQTRRTRWVLLRSIQK